jgi:uncharacterized protein
MFLDGYYLLLVVPTLILSIYAQIKVKSTFSKYSKIANKRGLTGRDAAIMLMRANSIADVSIERTAGSLTDHYDPTAKVLRLSQPVFDATSIAAIGVAAHETGHAIQHAKAYGPLALRSYLVPVANIGSTIGPYVAMAGLFFGMPFLLNVGIVLFSAAVVFYLITLPVEFNASNRALAMLSEKAILSDDELIGARKVLSAAALTYVASALTAMASLLRLILLSRNRD